MVLENLENWIKAGKIATETRAYALSIVKKGIPLVELAEKIEAKITELGGLPAFPVNLSINEIAAHFTPSHDDKTPAHGLLKIDLGVHVDGCIADTAVSVNLEDDKKNELLIEAANEALNKAIEKFELGAELGEVGEAVASAVKSRNLSPIINLSGHSLKRYELHAGLNIPNYPSGQSDKIEEGAYAIEPFVTDGNGKVIDGKPSGIYLLERDRQVRDMFARKVLAHIREKYKGLPFCSRWIYKEFGSRGLLALRQIEKAGILHHYPILVEKSRARVAQAEHTIILTSNKKIITTL
ncbi:type II methionyl aminopeptidase [Candidatus Pacearchaeota archaeon]|nr:MAG: type II methionyl aminopeptidase [Candidatus Pacearchaeota archaeon]